MVLTGRRKRRSLGIGGRGQEGGVIKERRIRKEERKRGRGEGGAAHHNRPSTKSCRASEGERRRLRSRAITPLCLDGFPASWGRGMGRGSRWVGLRWGGGVGGGRVRGVRGVCICGV